MAEHVASDRRISVNMRPEVLLRFLETGLRLHIFDRAAEVAASSSRSLDEVLQDLLGRWYRRRVTFEAALGGPHRFHYGALNTGGLGAPKYGALCVVFATGGLAAPTQTPAWIEQDSLKGPWWDVGDRLETGRLGPATALHEDLGALAALKLCASGAPGPDGDWPGLLCADDAYVEGLTITAPQVSMIEEVRVSEDFAGRLESAALASRRGTVDLTGLLDFDNYRRLRTGLNARRIPWVEVST